MDTLLKHNNEVQDNLMKLWDKYKEKLGLGEYSDEITLHITSQNTELLKKIARGEIERINELLKILDWHEPYRVCLEDQITHWQQVLQDLEK